MIKIGNLQMTDRGIKIVDKDENRLSMSEAFVKVVKRLSSIIEDFVMLNIHAVSEYLPIFIVRKIVFKLFGLKISKGSTIHMGCRFFSPWGVSIGEDTKIGQGAFLDGRGGLKIGNHVDFASEVMVYTSEHDVHSENFHAKEEPVEISDYVFIGPRAIILPGVKIEKGAVVAAGAVVTKDVNEFDIVGGVPAIKIGERKNKSPNYILGRSRLFQ